MSREDLQTLVDSMEEFVFIPSGVEVVQRTILEAALLGQLAHRSAEGLSGVELTAQLEAKVLESEDRPELPDGWVYVPLNDVAEIRLGRQRSPGRATGDRMRPYLRAANVSWQGLKLDDVKSMAFTAVESETFELRRGDLVLSEASGSPKEVGKPAQFAVKSKNAAFKTLLSECECISR